MTDLSLGLADGRSFFPTARPGRIPKVRRERAGARDRRRNVQIKASQGGMNATA
jgi:hypothetical protein